MTPGLLESKPAKSTAGNAFDHVTQLMERALHDIGQPLTSVALAVELLLLEPDAEVRHSMLLAARKECSRAIDDVTELRAQTNNLLRLADTTEEVEG